ncbi:MAG TPA: endo-1,3-alpha-glucanase family glycosylhydrolase [Thermomicrobiales bacterium]|nr:endo-1,3-alpha-glucanase family glycosylhydrolase [Thermomicrobiales bacterium]
MTRARPRRISSVLPALLMLLIMGMLSSAPVSAGASHGANTSLQSMPVLAYYYIWFQPDSWNRAKLDLPLLGPYASDDEAIMRLHVQWAKASGIDGFIVSWKNTETLSGRLATLVKVAREEDFKLSIIYEGLDFWRHPLPLDKIDADLDYFTETYGTDPVFDMFGKPIVIWSGTWEYDRTQIGRITRNHRAALRILASQKQPNAYERIADLVDGNAYYWSSVDPNTFPDYAGKLDRMSRTVHDHGGLWFAPAAPGFDARHLGGEREVTRNDGDTLRTQMETAASSRPDAIGLISWNEFSENSHVEPSCEYGDRYLHILADLLGGSAPTVVSHCDELALATAVAGANVGPPSGTPGTAIATPVPQAKVFDWDSSEPAGTVDRSARLGIFMLLGLMGGLMMFSVIKVARRAMSPPESGPATGSRRFPSNHNSSITH